MRLNQETDYAFRMVQAFSRLAPGTFLTAYEIAEENKIPYRFLLRVAKKLKRAGIALSRQGPDGGFRLARPARDISYLEVIEAIEGEININRCLRDTTLCNAGNAPECQVHKTLRGVQDKFRKELQKKHF